MAAEFIALDWGTTSFRAYRVAADGRVRDTISAPEGILAVKDGTFEAALEKHIGAWDVAQPVMAAGMITSRQGWIELPYLPCPASAADLADALHRHTTASGRRIAFVTGLSYRAPGGMPDVMRSEEVQVFGSLDLGLNHFVTPGTHSKWITTEGDRLVRYATYVTGEVFAALKDHTILGRLMKPGPDDEQAFAMGVRAALEDPAGFLHRIFSARSLGLFGELEPEAIPSYLSGQVIGTEVAHAIRENPRQAEYAVLASPGIGGRYVKAIEIAGLKVRYGDPQAIVKGLAIVAKKAGII
ncbi:MAG: 2-dehydro-3-deoxygalactonokinase [Aestuariivirga sp.]|uniref:2-dehydro-3-deoxygalactonokinase n=1 Tax=Aestuariivirga sp. TaxID=2650926 RepID=UPI0025BC46F5|nr:2-dehydro-3-deoxygalactonokinase [Aestuariivirga sp.]MCA3560357.1 2-dehydro-3-deoxygalactonokinase [Aestuariivirga sp.]